MKIYTKNITEIKADTIICFIYEDMKTRSPLFAHLNELSNNQLNKQLELNIFKGEYLETFKIAINQNIKVLLVGLGKYNDLTRKKFSIAMANAARSAKIMSKDNSIATEIVDFQEGAENISKKECTIITLTGLRIGLYDYDKYLSRL